MVHSVELGVGSTKGLKPNEDPEVLGGSLADVLDMLGPVQVTGDGNPEKFGLIDYFKGVAIGEAQLG